MKEVAARSEAQLQTRKVRQTHAFCFTRSFLFSPIFAFHEAGARLVLHQLLLWSLSSAASTSATTHTSGHARRRQMQNNR